MRGCPDDVKGDIKLDHFTNAVCSALDLSCARRDGCGIDCRAFDSARAWLGGWTIVATIAIGIVATIAIRIVATIAIRTVGGYWI